MARYIFFVLLVAIKLYAAKASLKIEEAESSTILWPTFYKDYVKTNRPLVLHKACTDNPAYRLWSPDYIYYHPGAALTFRNLTERTNASIRKIIEQRDDFKQLYFSTPSFLSDDLKLPNCLECELLTSNINNPLWLWNFQVSVYNCLKSFILGI